MPLETLFYLIGTLFLFAGGVVSAIASKNAITIQFAAMFTYINYLLFLHGYFKEVLK